MRSWLLSFIINFTVRGLNSLPFSFALKLGRWLGFLFYYFSNNKRRVALRNLKIVFPEKDYHQLSSIARISFMNFGMTVIENLLWEKSVNQYKKIIPEKVFNYKNNFIFVGIHSGNWELYNSIFAQNRPLAVLARPQKPEIVGKFINDQRAKFNIIVKENLVGLVRCIKKGYNIGLVIDHGPEGKAYYSNFCGQIVPTPSGAVRLAQHFKKEIIPIFGSRTKKGEHVFLVGKAINPDNKSIPQLLDQLNKQFEDFLKDYPYAYLWWYKRFKRKINRKIIILSDGKAGHVKQSRTLANLFQEQYSQITIKEYTLSNIGFLRRVISEIITIFCPRRFMKIYNLLSLIFPKQQWDLLKKEWADIIISTGSSIAPFNYLFSVSLAAKNIVILKPNVFLDKFDLSIIPEHDYPPPCKNTVVIKGVLISPHSPAEDAERLKEKLPLSRRKKVALFIGGPLDKEEVFLSQLPLFLEKLKNFCRKNNYGIFCTTSRRTPEEAEIIIEENLAKFPLTEALIIANRENYNWVLGSFLYLSDVIFITSDSISMLCESLALQKITVAVKLEDINRSHHVNFYASLAEWINQLPAPYNFYNFSLPPFSLWEYNKNKLVRAIDSIIKANF